MESESNTLLRVRNESAQDWYKKDFKDINIQQRESLINDISKIYHSERLKQLTLSDEEQIHSISMNWFGKTRYEYKNAWSFRQGFRQGFKKAIELLTINK